MTTKWYFKFNSGGGSIEVDASTSEEALTEISTQMHIPRDELRVSQQPFDPMLTTADVDGLYLKLVDKIQREDMGGLWSTKLSLAQRVLNKDESAVAQLQLLLTDDEVKAAGGDKDKAARSLARSIQDKADATNSYLLKLDGIRRRFNAVANNTGITARELHEQISSAVTEMQSGNSH